MPTVTIQKKTLRLGDLLHLDDTAVQARLKLFLNPRTLSLPAAIIRSLCHIRHFLTGAGNRLKGSANTYAIQAHL